MDLGLTFAQIGVHPPASLHVLRHVVQLQLLAHRSPNLYLRLKPSGSHCPPTLKLALINPPTNKLHLKATNHRLHMHPPTNKLYLKGFITHRLHPPTNKLYLKATNYRLNVHPPTNKLYLKSFITHRLHTPTNKLYLKATTHLQPAPRFARSQTVVHNATSVVALRLLPTF